MVVVSVAYSALSEDLEGLAAASSVFHGELMKQKGTTGLFLDMIQGTEEGRDKFVEVAESASHLETRAVKDQRIPEGAVRETEELRVDEDPTEPTDTFPTFGAETPSRLRTKTSAA